MTERGRNGGLTESTAYMEKCGAEFFCTTFQYYDCRLIQSTTDETVDDIIGGALAG
jgi:hypothetical protein